MDGYPLRNILAQEPLVNLVKEGTFEFWGIFELMGVPKLEKERSGRICARKGRPASQPGLRHYAAQLPCQTSAVIPLPLHSMP